MIQPLEVSSSTPPPLFDRIFPLIVMFWEFSNDMPYHGVCEIIVLLEMVLLSDEIRDMPQSVLFVTVLPLMRLSLESSMAMPSNLFEVITLPLTVIPLHTYKWIPFPPFRIVNPLMLTLSAVISTTVFGSPLPSIMVVSLPAPLSVRDLFMTMFS